jgi:hypothetical protein
MIGSWLIAAHGAEVITPPVPSADVAWSALTKYITVNRLYDQWSVAVQLVSQVAIQFLPDTAEAQVWLGVSKSLALPIFSSIRGRYIIFNEGESALLSHRAMNEWAFLGSTLERLVLYATALNQAFQTGAAVRSVRRINERNPKDLDASTQWVQSADTSYQAFASEALRHPVPLNGMLGVGTVITDMVDGFWSHPRRVPVNVPSAPGYIITSVDGDNYLEVKHVPTPGVPNLLLPIAPYGENTPYGMQAHIHIPDEARQRNSCELDPYAAWQLAWVARICGYDVEIETNVTPTGPQRYFASNETSWTHPLMVSQYARRQKIYVTDIVPRDNVFIDMPAIHTMRYKGDIHFTMTMIDCGVTPRRGIRAKRIVDYGHHGGVMSSSAVRINVPYGLQELSGSVLRGQQDFQFVEYVQAGVIPPELQPSGAGDAVQAAPAGGGL